MRLGVPSELIEWLVELEMDARVSVRTLWTVGVWETEGLAGFAKESGTDDPFTFNPERGTGQGDISSPHTWVAVFDILLRALEEVKSEPFLLDCTGGGMHPAPEVGYADDLISLMGSLLGLQDKADMVSACSQLLGLTIASPKLRVFRADWTSGSLSITPEDGVLVVHGTRWTPEEVPVQVDGAVKALGVHYDLALTGQTQLDLSPLSSVSFSPRQGTSRPLRTLSRWWWNPA